VFQWYHDELAVAMFISELEISLGNQVQEYILGGDTVPSLYHSISSSSYFYGSIFSSGENSTMIVRGRGRGEGHGRVYGRNSGRECGHRDKGPCHCAHCGRIIIHQINAGTSFNKPG